METGLEKFTDQELLDHLENIQGNDRFDQREWNFKCLELFRRIMRDRVQRNQIQ